ncbi:hypothetical protein D9756_005214 [Leucocoprinus leucothites]|uniref:Pentatricopeptide repeat-containing protein-mitochondrial domain-containing protein n=1 Tax=Leucocoprinus leucothites TaxID=201217 RepID=A0A8H5D6X3_9AGAR|nr:hypothetical protein D9756_005214 [Leucoagaricus leucothites]
MTSRASLARLFPRLHRRALHSGPALPVLERSNIDRPFSRSQQTRYAVQLMSPANARQFLPCVTIAAEMKEKGVEPNLAIYNSMLAAAAEDGFWLEAWAILDDMLLMGVRPNTMSFNHLLHAVRFRHSHHVPRVLEKMEACGVKPNPQTMTPIISRYTAEGNLEMAVRHLLSFTAHDMVPGLQAAQSVITLAARNNFARLALDLAEWFERLSTRRLEESVWVNCLLAAAETSYIEGVERCWELLTKQFKSLLDEGTCVAVLNTAARNGRPELATEALQMLQTINISPQEHHFAAIIEAFCVNGRAREAILVLDLMSSSGVDSSIGTAEPIAECIQHDVERIDAAWKQIEELHKEGHRLHSSTHQAIIMAAVASGNLTRALAFYRALPDLGLSPKLDTFNHLLQGCIQSADRQLGDTLLAEMKTAKVKPNQDIHESFIRLCLTQDVYEDAFFYLEEMKTAGYKPSPSIYTALAEKCLSSNDLRYRIVLQEMEECGYGVPSDLKTHLRLEEKDEVAATSAVPRLSEEEQRFIEKGGLV